MDTKKILTLNDCESILAACLAEATRQGWAVTVAVVDDSGSLLLLARMDGATLISPEISMGKARTAALTRRPSHWWDQHISEGRTSLLGMPILPVQGGLPIQIDGITIGGIGVSGVRSDQDEQIAESGITAFNS